MQLRHPDYIKLVIEAYKKKRANNELSPLLMQSTPAGIRRECVNVYKERYDKKDEQALRAFFGPVESGKKFLQLIQEFETDKFRPLDNYIKGNTEKTEDRNLELLAWLIDFRHRPYVYDKQVQLNEEELLIIGNSNKNAGNNQTTKREQHGLQRGEERSPENEVAPNILSHAAPNKKRNILKKVIGVFFIAVICFAGLYFIRLQKKNKQMRLESVVTSCMYWTGDHYAEMPCNEDRKDRFKLPMDLERAKNFKRILREDTITEKSIGRIYYIKIDGRIEYYTAPGNHPVEITRTLKPLSYYMFVNHLLKKENATKDPAIQ
jgi:hypothetical protein